MHREEVKGIILCAKDYYSRHIENGTGMCKAFDYAFATRHIFINTYNDIVEYIPEFNRKTAIEKFNGYISPYWWDYENTQDRLNYFDWLIEKYS